MNKDKLIGIVWYGAAIFAFLFILFLLGMEFVEWVSTWR